MNPIRVGIIGVHPDKGWATMAHIPALQQLAQFRIVAVSHHDQGLAGAAAAKAGAAHAFSSSQALVAHPDVDLVVVSVKVQQHRALVEQAINAGKAVYCEWPLGSSLEEAEALRDLARARGVVSAIGLQTRAAPAFAYARALVKDGYVGKVLSSTVIGSGILWGGAMNESYLYTLDRSVGAAMLNVPFAHTIDGVLHLLDDGIAGLCGLLGNARKHTTVAETGASVPLTVPDQVAITAQLRSGAVLTAHFRGGLSRATNFHVEINGSDGDLVITSPVGYVGIGGMQLMGASKDGALQALDIPSRYAPAAVDGPAQLVACAYASLAEDMLTGSRHSPNFDDAVALHRLIDRIERDSAART